MQDIFHSVNCVPFILLWHNQLIHKPLINPGTGTIVTIIWAPHQSPAKAMLTFDSPNVLIFYCLWHWNVTGLTWPWNEKPAACCAIAIRHNNSRWHTFFEGSLRSNLILKWTYTNSPATDGIYQFGLDYIGEISMISCLKQFSVCYRHKMTTQASVIYWNLPLLGWTMLTHSQSPGILYISGTNAYKHFVIFKILKKVKSKLPNAMCSVRHLFVNTVINITYKMRETQEST